MNMRFLKRKERGTLEGTRLPTPVRQDVDPGTRS
jgi:hypothetical protein